MTKRARHRGGWLLTEAIVTLMLLGVLLTTVLSVRAAAGRANHCQLTRQRCIAAAQAALDSITATGEGIPAGDVERLWPGVKVRVRRERGEGDWSGLALVTASATGRSGTRVVSVELRRYVARRGGEDRP